LVVVGVAAIIIAELLICTAFQRFITVEAGSSFGGCRVFGIDSGRKLLFYFHVQAFTNGYIQL